MAINDSLKRLEEVIKERDLKHSEFVRNILVIASTVLGILVSLHKSQSTDQLGRISFDFAMVSLAVGILSGACTLYKHVNISQKVYEGLRDAIIKQLQNKAESFEGVVGNPSVIFEYAEKLCYLSLCIAVISLCVYAITTY